MEKKQTFSIKISAEEAEIFKAQAAALGLTNRDYFCLLISSSEPKKDVQESVKNDDFERIESKITALAAQFGAFVAAQSEQKRVPSFYEYRARKIVETRPAPPKSSTEKLSLFLEIARAYWREHGLWPDASDTVAFGPGLTPEQVAAWPATPRQ